MKRLFLTLALAATSPWTAVAAEPTVEHILNSADDAMRGESSHARIEMYVKTDRYERTMTMEAWSKGTEKTLIRIVDPAKDAGTTTLKVDDNIWNYLPKVDRTMKIPAGMMSGSWMGSHFTNDDLVRETRLSEDYVASMDQRPADNPEHVYKITLTPKPDAPVVWGRQELTVGEDLVQVVARYYDEKGELVRTMSWADVKELAGRKVPTTMTLTPNAEPNELTRIRYLELELGIDLADTLFSLQSLKE